MIATHENSAGIIPFRRDRDRDFRLYLVLHSATVRNPRARWEFPKGGMEVAETTRDTASREFREETGLLDWTFRPGFERSLTYTYVRRGRKVLKTVTYYLAEVLGDPMPIQSIEHVEDGTGHCFRWGSFTEITRLLYHAKIRQVFAEAEDWLNHAKLD